MKTTLAFSLSTCLLAGHALAQSVSNSKVVNGQTYTSISNTLRTGYPNVTAERNFHPGLGWNTSITIPGNPLEFGPNIGVMDNWVRINNDVIKAGNTILADTRWYGNAAVDSSGALEYPSGNPPATAPFYSANTVTTSMSGGLNTLTFRFVDGRTTIETGNSANARYALQRVIVPSIDTSGPVPLVVQDVFDTITNLSASVLDFSMGSYADLDIDFFPANRTAADPSFVGGVKFFQYGDDAFDPIIFIAGKNTGPVAAQYERFTQGGRNTFFLTPLNAAGGEPSSASVYDVHNVFQWNSTLAPGQAFTSEIRYAIMLAPEPAKVMLLGMGVMLLTGRRRRGNLA